jgi:hypothetical protein
VSLLEVLNSHEVDVVVRATEFTKVTHILFWEKEDFKAKVGSLMR